MTSAWESQKGSVQKRSADLGAATIPLKKKSRGKTKESDEVESECLYCCERKVSYTKVRDALAKTDERNGKVYMFINVETATLEDLVSKYRRVEIEQPYEWLKEHKIVKRPTLKLPFRESVEINGNFVTSLWALLRKLARSKLQMIPLLVVLPSSKKLTTKNMLNNIEVQARNGDFSEMVVYYSLSLFSSTPIHTVTCFRNFLVEMILIREFGVVFNADCNFFVERPVHIISTCCHCEHGDRECCCRYRAVRARPWWVYIFIENCLTKLLRRYFVDGLGQFVMHVDLHSRLVFYHHEIEPLL